MIGISLGNYAVPIFYSKLVYHPHRFLCLLFSARPSQGCRILKERVGNKNPLIFTHLQENTTDPHPRAEVCKFQRWHAPACGSSLTTCRRMYGVNPYGGLTLPIMASSSSSRLPGQVALKWAEISESK